MFSSGSSSQPLVCPSYGFSPTHVSTLHDCKTPDFTSFENLLRKRRRFLNHLSFLTTCRNKKLVPSFINIKCGVVNTFSSSRIKKTVKRCELSILRSVIKDTRSQLAFTEKDLYHLYNKLSLITPSLIFDIFLERIHNQVDSASFTHKLTQHKKLIKLMSSVKPQSALTPIVLNDPIVNMSSRLLTNTDTEALSLGLNFAIAKKVDKVKSVIELESAFSRIKSPSVNLKAEIDSTRTEVCSLLCSNSQIKPNLQKQLLDSLISLKKDPDIAIMKADKGGQITIVNTSDYIANVDKLLDNPCYEPSSKDTSIKSLSCLKKTIKNSLFLSEFEKRICTPSNARPSKFYALPKVHKIDGSFRPIVSSLGTASYSLAHLLTDKLKHLTQFNTHSLKNSEQLINALKNKPIPNNALLVSFDVKALFPSIPLSDSIDTLERRLNETACHPLIILDILDLVEACTENVQFIVNGKLFNQVEGLAMGNPLSPLLSDIYMHYFETDMLKLSPPNLYNWFRYVDDTFCFFVGTQVDLDNFLIFLNSLNKNIQFTMEFHAKKLPFLDLLIENVNDLPRFSIFRKPFAVTLPIHIKSAHPWSQKMSSFYFFTRRALIVCSDEEALSCEINFLKNVAVDRGYDARIVDFALDKFRKKLHNLDSLGSTLSTNVSNSNFKYHAFSFYSNFSSKIIKPLKKLGIVTAFSASNSIERFLGNVKHKFHVHSNWGIYEITCQCGLSYIGQTKRSLSVRIKEHKHHTYKNEIDKSAIAKHSVETGHVFSFDDTVLLFQPRYTSVLNIAEATFIRLKQNNLINGNISPFLSYTWNKALT